MAKAKKTKGVKKVKTAKATKTTKTTKTTRTRTTAGPREGSKLAVVAEMLLSKRGTTRADIMEATGWPSVSVDQQAKLAGITLRRERDGRTIRYFGTSKAKAKADKPEVAAAPKAPKAKAAKAKAANPAKAKVVRNPTGETNEQVVF